MEESKSIRGIKINYSQNNNKIYQKKNLSSEDKFVCQISSNSDESIYVGILDENFSRNRFGFMKYKNGDFYYGEWKENKKQGIGIYFYHNGDLYCGKWTENSKNDFGIYFWIKGNNYYECFLGKFVNDRRMSGICISNEIRKPNFENEDIPKSTSSTSSYLYFGEFIENKKFCNSSYLFDYQRDMIFYGSIMNDIARKGYQLKLNKENENEEITVSSIIEFEISELNPENVIRVNEMPAVMKEASTEIILNKCKNFFRIIVNKNYLDYCGDIYAKLLSIKNTAIDLNSFFENYNSVKNLIIQIINENINYEETFNFLNY